MKLFRMVFEQEYFGQSDEELIALNRSGELTGIPYFALQRVLSKRGLNTNRIIEIEKENKTTNTRWDYKNLMIKWYSYLVNYPKKEPKINQQLSLGMQPQQ